jgi:F420-dependent oxidoreductase-like protein
LDLGIFVAPQEGATYADQLVAARTAEACGFGAFVRSDHILANDDAIRLPGPTDTWITLAGLARETATIRIGTLVSAATFRLPAHLAIIAAQVDEMSAGRLVFGLGAGWNGREHEALGFEFPSAAVRFERLAEQLEVLEGLWATPIGERFSYDGTHYRLVEAPGLPKPRRTPGPWLVLGGVGTAKTPALAARFADEFNVPPSQSPEAMAQQFERVDQACEAIGRAEPPERSVVLTTICGRTDLELARRAQVAPEALAHADLRGSPARVVEQLAAYAAAGAARAYLRILDLFDLDHIELLAEALISTTADRGPRSPHV